MNNRIETHVKMNQKSTKIHARKSDARGKERASQGEPKREPNSTQRLQKVTRQIETGIQCRKLATKTALGGGAFNPLCRPRGRILAGLGEEGG